MNFRDSIPFKAKGIIIPKNKIYWWASNGHELIKTPIIYMLDSLLHSKPQNIALNIQNKFVESYVTKNVLAYIPGAEVPDSFVVFTAHYDHLGAMGKGNFFPGANDNASGTAMVLSLARYFSQPKNKPKYSIAFMLFAAEESGLLGSMYYTANPTFPLKQIKYLINLDMVGSGSEGISLVNGKANLKLTEKFKKINLEHGFFTDIKIGGESCNSDHCFFHKAGVPSVFIYTRGPECQAYHNLNDVSAKTPLTKFTELSQMLILLSNE
jgi:Zn-dependent M28 family amino/carboxypeptidase